MIRTIKTKQFKIIAALLAVVLTVSCVMLNATKAHALEITDAATSGYTVFGGGTVTDGKLTNTSIGVYVTGGTADKYNASNMKWTHNGSAWSTESKVLFEGRTSQQKISAYYPYVQDYTSGGLNYALTATQTAETLANDDLMYASATDLTFEKVDLNFKHIMTKLAVNVTGLGTEIAPATNISKVEISGLAATATFYPENGTLTADDDDLTGTTVAYNNGTTYEALVFPAAYSTVTVKVTMEDNRVFTTTVNCPVIDTTTNATGFVAGYQYNISLQVGQDVVNVSGITAEAWDKVTVDEPLKTE